MELQRRRVALWLCLVIMASAAIMYQISTLTVMWPKKSYSNSYPGEMIINDRLNEVISEENSSQINPGKRIVNNRLNSKENSSQLNPDEMIINDRLNEVINKENSSQFKPDKMIINDRLNKVISEEKASQLNRDAMIVNDRLNEVISEQEALQYKPCKDINLVANPNVSTLWVLGSQSKVYSIGDKIFAQATLFDSYGKQKTTGGDHLRARIYNKAIQAYAPGAVYDHKNGSYTLIFEALWSGQSYISATIAYTREAITAQYRMTKQLGSLRRLIAKYKAQKHREEAPCDSDKSFLIATTKHTDACNFTKWNSGMPWYCGKPRNPNLKCTDWKSIGYVSRPWRKLLSMCERELIAKRFHQVLLKVVKVMIKEPTQKIRGKSIKYYQPSVSCVNYNTTRLWYEKYTTGFFFKRHWKLRHCDGFHRANFQKCLRNKTLYLIGDSTVRQWYVDILKRYKCTQFTEKLTHDQWTGPSSCKVASNNFTVYNTWHSQPLILRVDWTDRIEYRFTSVLKQLENIGTNEDAIVLIHVFLHMARSHFKYYKAKMVQIRFGVEKLLKRNTKVKIFIKLPHTYTGIRPVTDDLNDFYGYVYTSIIFESFRGLYDKVIVLDNKDATNSIASADLHPRYFIVTSMVDQMFSYICK